MKKRNLFIILSALAFVFAVACFFACSIILDNQVESKYGLCTLYESSYNQCKNGLIFIAFTPICILSFICGFKYKQKSVKIVSAVLILVMTLIGFVNLKDAKHYSTSIDYLKSIEETVNIRFPDGATILVDESISSYSKNDSVTEIVCEGIIRTAWNANFKTEIESNPMWHRDVEPSVRQALSELFYVQISSLESFVHHIDDDNTLTFLAYNMEKQLIYFSIVKIAKT